MAEPVKKHPPTDLIGAPTDIGADNRGGSMGPEALRVAGLQKALGRIDKMLRSTFAYVIRDRR